MGYNSDLCHYWQSISFPDKNSSSRGALDLIFRRKHRGVFQHGGLTLATLLVALQVFFTGIATASASASLNSAFGIICLTKDTKTSEDGKSQPSSHTHHNDHSCCIIHHGNVFLPEDPSPILPHASFPLAKNEFYTQTRIDFISSPPELGSLSPRAPPSHIWEYFL